jgi:hypothetical protein
MRSVPSLPDADLVTAISTSFDATTLVFPITLGVRPCTKPLVFQARKCRPCGFDFALPQHSHVTSHLRTAQDVEASWTTEVGQGPYIDLSPIAAGDIGALEGHGSWLANTDGPSFPRPLHALNCRKIVAVSGSAGKKASSASSDSVMSRGVPNIVVVEMSDNKPTSVTSFKGTKTPP